MACYDPNSLTASGTGELSVHLKTGFGLAKDADGIFVDYSNTGCESGLHLASGKLSTLQTPTLSNFNALGASGGGYAGLPVTTTGAGAVQTNFTGHMPLVNNSCYTGMAVVTAWQEYDADVNWLAEWQNRLYFYVNGGVADTIQLKFRNDMNVPGGVTGTMNRWSQTYFRSVPPGATMTFGLSTVSFAHHGTVVLNRAWVHVEGVIINAPTV